MRNEKKLAYQQKQINALKEQVKSLEQENKILEQENTSLLKINAENKSAIKQLEDEHEKFLDRYATSMAEIKELKAQYGAAIQSANEIKQNYSDKMEVLLKQLRKQI